MNCRARFIGSATADVTAIGDIHEAAQGATIHGTDDMSDADDFCVLLCEFERALGTEGEPPRWWKELPENDNSFAPPWILPEAGDAHALDALERTLAVHEDIDSAAGVKRLRSVLARYEGKLDKLEEDAGKVGELEDEYGWELERTPLEKTPEGFQLLRSLLAQGARMLDESGRRLAERGDEDGGTENSTGWIPQRSTRQAPTFREAVDQVDLVEEFHSLLDLYASALASIRVSRIEIRHLLEVLNPIWHLLPAEADGVREGISTIMQWAIGQGFRANDISRESFIKRVYGEHRPDELHEHIRRPSATPEPPWWFRDDIPGDFGFWWRRSGFGRRFPRSLPRSWVDWLTTCVEHGCLDPHHVDSESFFLCRGFPFDRYPPPAETVECWPYTGVPGYEDRPDLMFAGFVRWARKLLQDVQEAWPYPREAERFGDNAEDAQAVVAYARWLDQCLDLEVDWEREEGATEWEPFEEGGNVVYLKSLDKRLLELKRDVLQDLLNRAKKDAVWYRVLRMWTRTQISLGHRVPQMVSEWWDARPQEPPRRGGRPMNLVVVQARARALMRLLTEPHGNGVLPVDPKSSKNAGAVQLVAALLRCQPGRVRYAHDQSLDPHSLPRFLSLFNRREIMLDGEPRSVVISENSLRP